MPTTRCFSLVAAPTPCNCAGIPQPCSSCGGETTVAGKFDLETVVQGVVQNIQMDSCIDALNSVGSQGLDYQDCESLLARNVFKMMVILACHVRRNHFVQWYGMSAILLPRLRILCFVS